MVRKEPGKRFQDNISIAKDLFLPLFFARSLEPSVTLWPVRGGLGVGRFSPAAPNGA